jgi:hypothetical protein
MATAREQMLEALAVVLRSMDGVKTVRRQALSEQMLTDAELPGIIIDEIQTDGAWEAKARRVMKLTSQIVLDCQMICRRTPAMPDGNASTARELFADAVLSTLANNPQLRVLLDGEVEVIDPPVPGGTPRPPKHAMDVLGARVNVRYEAEQPPYARVLIAITPVVHTTYDNRAVRSWTEVVITASTQGPDEASVETTLELDGPLTTQEDISHG